MTDHSSEKLKELQDLDLQIEKTRRRIEEFEPLLAEVEEPVLTMEQELAILQKRLQEMKLEERRLEHSADGRRARMKKLQERLKSVRNLREEAAVQAEMDLLKSALEGEEQEALTLLDQIRKMELRMEEVEEALEEARAAVEPRRQELEKEQEDLRREVRNLEMKRGELASDVPSRALESYERIKGGGRSVAVAEVTPDGACGNCFSMVPIQIRNELRETGALITCEACGVLLSPGEEPL